MLASLDHSRAGKYPIDCAATPFVSTLVKLYLDTMLKFYIISTVTLDHVEDNTVRLSVECITCHMILN